MDSLVKIETKIKAIYDSYYSDLKSGWITGDGPCPCKILFLGEAPGKTEVELGKPFVGLAGSNFEKYINSIGLSRNEIRITNTCYLRPIKIKTNPNGKETISNRTPNTKEIKLFWDVLEDEIKLVNPKIIITLGNVPLKRLTNQKAIGECHGVDSFSTKYNCLIFPMYHPSALSYNRNSGFIAKYNTDFLKLKNVLECV